jgi:anion transporter
MGAAIVVGLGTVLLPTPHGLSRPAHLIVAVTAFSILLWVFQIMNNGISSVLMIGLMILVGVRPALALSGFAGPAFWILLVVLFYGFAMQRTGLAQRLSFYILSLFPITYSGILWAFFLIGAILALGIPSMTVRTAIMVPIAWALVQSLRLAPRSRGTALIMLTVVEMAVVPGLAFLYGSLNGPVVEATFQTKQLPLTWTSYATTMAFPTLILSVLIVFANQLVLKPEAALQVSDDFAKAQLKAMGTIKRTEWVTAIVVILSIAFWATGRMHHLPSFLVGTFALAIFGLFGIVRDVDIATGVSWSLLLYLGGILSLANVIQEFKITDWLAGYMIPIANRLAFSTVSLLVITAFAMLLLRFLDPSAFVAIPVLFLPIVDTSTVHGVPPMVLMGPILLASAPFWLSYENFWIAMGEGMTSGQAYSASQRVWLANAYALICLIVVPVSVLYWRLVGLL